jgi:hypothetical protein
MLEAMKSRTPSQQVYPQLLVAGKVVICLLLYFSLLSLSVVGPPKTVKTSGVNHSVHRQRHLQLVDAVLVRILQTYGKRVWTTRKHGGHFGLLNDAWERLRGIS